MAVASSVFYTEESRRFMEELLKLSPGSQNGGIYAPKIGYHNTRKANAANWPGNYSIIDTTDKKGPDDKSAGYDWTFPTAQGGNYAAISLFSKRLIASAKDLADPRLNNWREFYGQADTDLSVEGWDFRYGRAATSDSSHLWHIHLSESRAYVGSWENKLVMLSVLRGESLAEWLGDEVKIVKSKQTGLLWAVNGTSRYQFVSSAGLAAAKSVFGISDAEIKTVDELALTDPNGGFGPDTRTFSATTDPAKVGSALAADAAFISALADSISAKLPKPGMSGKWTTDTIE